MTKEKRCQNVCASFPCGCKDGECFLATTNQYQIIPTIKIGQNYMFVQSGGISGRSAINKLTIQKSNKDTHAI